MRTIKSGASVRDFSSKLPAKFLADLAAIAAAHEAGMIAAGRVPQDWNDLRPGRDVTAERLPYIGGTTPAYDPMSGMF